MKAWHRFRLSAWLTVTILAIGVHSSHAQGALTAEPEGGLWVHGGTAAVQTLCTIEFFLRLTNYTGYAVTGLPGGFGVVSPDGVGPFAGHAAVVRFDIPDGGAGPPGGKARARLLIVANRINIPWTTQGR